MGDDRRGYVVLYPHPSIPADERTPLMSLSTTRGGSRLTSSAWLRHGEFIFPL